MHPSNDSSGTINNPVIKPVSGFVNLPIRSPGERKLLKKHIPELLWFERLLRNCDTNYNLRIEHNIKCHDHDLPLYSLCLGNTTDQSVPTLMLTGGVHGVERIGTQVILSWLDSFFERLTWDAQLREKLTKLQIVIVPMVNPYGVYNNLRCNGNGVDLNRNAPINAEDEVPFLLGGHRISNRLPWYRGRAGLDLEMENQALQRVIERCVYTHPLSLSLDVHSGFGMRDRLWFPYAFRRKPIGTIDQFLALKVLWERTFPNHNYEFEPQSNQYLSHGDIWDYFYLQSQQHSKGMFLPLTLELGSWIWVKKRPLQIFNFAGLFNPQKQHRHSRVLRQHLLLFDFLVSAALNYKTWIPDKNQAIVLSQAAKAMWFK